MWWNGVLYVLCPLLWVMYKVLTYHRPALPDPKPVPRIVLVGDSILDNRPYAGTRGSTAQILATLAPDIVVETVAHDGDVMADVHHQLSLLEPCKDTLAVVSIGGNDCLRLLNSLGTWAFFRNVCSFLWTYGDEYEATLRLVTEQYGEVLALNLYGLNSTCGALLGPAVMLVNWLMARRAQRLGVRVIDIHGLFTHASDYACIAYPEYARVIEPSARGAFKIAAAVLEGRIQVRATPLYVGHNENKRMFLVRPTVG